MDHYEVELHRQIGQERRWLGSFFAFIAVWFLAGAGVGFLVARAVMK